VAYAPAGSVGAGSPAYDMVYGITQLMSADVTEVIKGNNVATDTVTYIVYPPDGAKTENISAPPGNSAFVGLQLRFTDVGVNQVSGICLAVSETNTSAHPNGYITGVVPSTNTSANAFASANTYTTVGSRPAHGSTYLTGIAQGTADNDQLVYMIAGCKNFYPGGVAPVAPPAAPPAAPKGGGTEVEVGFFERMRSRKLLVLLFILLVVCGLTYATEVPDKPAPVGPRTNPDLSTIV
jgi:hypothetical protein